MGVLLHTPKSTIVLRIRTPKNGTLNFESHYSRKMPTSISMGFSNIGSLPPHSFGSLHIALRLTP